MIFTIASKHQIPREKIYTKDSKVLLQKKKKEYLNIPCSWIGRLNIVTLSIIPTFIYRFRKVLIKILAFLCGY